MREATASFIAHLANCALADMYRYFWIQGADNLCNLDKATLLMVVANALQEKSRKILDEDKMKTGECNE